LVQLSDGSTYTARTTSPLPLYRASKDTRNTLLWQPSEKSLRNVELDEAGKLAAFRERFGRGYDAAAQAVEGEPEGDKAADAETAEQAAAKPAEEDTGLNFEDLLAEYTPQDTGALKDSGPKKAPTRRK
ncbi:mitochondrial ribosomal, partial [Trichoderma arundinaceum]